MSNHCIKTALKPQSSNSYNMAAVFFSQQAVDKKKICGADWVKYKSKLIKIMLGVFFLYIMNNNLKI
jgi:hypothetical protein